MDRRWLGSWLSGPSSSGVGEPDVGRPGERLGLPAAGPGSVAGFGQRLGALLVDWLACVLIVRGLAGVDRGDLAGTLAVPALFALENVLLVGTLGYTLGMRLLRVRVVRLDGRPPGPGAATLRTVLLLLAVPALIWDRDRRGLHDRAASTVAVTM